MRFFQKGGLYMDEKKVYEIPQVEIILFESAEIMTASGEVSYDDLLG